jgi:hypothetical protein
MMGAKGAGGVKTEQVDGMDHDTNDTLEGETRRKGGLVRSGKDVSIPVMDVCRQN